ncbi:MAG: LOG family protein [Parcubacteria group bacterium]|nr:LOG family protein [Parcubacteria group bacterium]
MTGKINTYRICVSGSAESHLCSERTAYLAEEVGRQIVKNGGIILTGATTGVPHWATKGAKQIGGFTLAFSPAASEKEHTKVYRLPVDYFDVIVYTGFNYAGRNLILTRAADAVVFICGRIGTLNEFTIAFEDHKPIGVLEETGGTADHIREIVSTSHRGPGKIVYDTDPKELIIKVIRLIEKDRA